MNQLIVLTTQPLSIGSEIKEFTHVLHFLSHQLKEGNISSNWFVIIAIIALIVTIISCFSDKSSKGEEK